MTVNNIYFIHIATIGSDVLFFGVAAFLLFIVKQHFNHQKRQAMLWFMTYWFASSIAYGVFVLLCYASHTLSLIIGSSVLQAMPYILTISIFKLYERVIPRQFFLISFSHVILFTLFNTLIHLYNSNDAYLSIAVTYFSIMSVFSYAAYLIYSESLLNKIGDKILYFSIIFSLIVSVVALATDFILKSPLESIVMIVLAKNSIFCMQLVAIMMRFFFYEIEWHHERSIRDKLTGLYNRRYFEDQAKLLLKHPKEYCYLAIVDVDHFKPINDKYGHLNGDIVLEKLSELLWQFFGSDLVARYGGEEFVILLRDQEGTRVHQKLSQFREAVAKHTIYIADEKVFVTVSIGVARLHSEKELVSSFAHADKALYEAKSQGRNQLITI